jgi:hypothetical protein
MISLLYLLSAFCCLFFFDTEDGGSMFLRNVDELLSEYKIMTYFFLQICYKTKSQNPKLRVNCVATTSEVIRPPCWYY